MKKVYFFTVLILLLHSSFITEPAQVADESTFLPLPKSYSSGITQPANVLTDVNQGSGTINLTIPDEDPNGASDIINITGIPGGALVDSIIISITLTHPFLSDAVVNVEAPNSAVINLVADKDCDDLLGFQDTRLSSDNSLPAVPVYSPVPFTGTFKPDAKTQNALNTSPNNNGVVTIPTISTTTFSDLFSTLNGNWKIHAYDVFIIDIGTLVSWSIKISYHLPSLPVTLLSFSGYRDYGKNLLKWTTTSEQNNLGFYVERSADGINYTSIGYVHSLAPSGQSNTYLNYSYIDSDISGERQYYRLRQIDFDSHEKVSRIILINGIYFPVFAIGSLFPNPAGNEVNVLIIAPGHDKLLIRIMDTKGSLVKQMNFEVKTGSNTIPLDITSLQNGTYFLKIISKWGSKPVTAKFTKQ